MDSHSKELYTLFASNRQKFMVASAESEDANIVCLRAFCLHDGIGVARDVPRALHMIRRCLDEVSHAAVNGEIEAQTSLGRIYYDGLRVEKDYKRAFKWYIKAVEQMCARAQNGIGLMYANGRGVEKDYAVAVDWCRKAAEHGYALYMSVMRAMNNVLITSSHGVNMHVPSDQILL